jgi:hypothetical protein
MRSTKASNSASIFRAARSLALCGTIELLSHKLMVPREDRVGCDDTGDLRQRLLAQFLADLG